MEEYSSDELQAPAWLNDQFFTKILQTAENDPSIKLRDGFKLRPATMAGDHFASIMFRTSVRFLSNRLPDEQVMNLIIKAQPTAEGYKKELAKDNVLFRTEIKMYSEILPAMLKVLNGVGEHLEMPRLLYASLQPNVVIVLEDLSPKGWLPGRECIGSFEEALPTIRNIANFHAASIYLQQTTVDLSTNSAKDIFASGPAFAFFTREFAKFCDTIDKWQGYETYARKLKILHRTMQKRLQKVYTANPQTVGYNVLNHGDFNWKNILHKKNPEDRIVDSMLIDYQCCHWGSPAVDVLCLLDMIVNNRTKTAYRNEIIFEYHQQFATVLSRIGFKGKIPSLIDLQIELLRNGFLEVMHVTVVEQFKFVKITEITLDDNNAGKLDDSCFQNEEFRKIIQSELPSLMHKGFLDE